MSSVAVTRAVSRDPILLSSIKQSPKNHSVNLVFILKSYLRAMLLARHNYFGYHIEVIIKAEDKIGPYTYSILTAIRALDY